MRAGRALRRARATTAVVVLTLLAACNGGDPEGREPVPSASTSAANATPSPTTVLDPEHAVELPGPREGVVAPPDILVTNPKSLDPETVAAIADLEHVTDVELISLSQVLIENEAVFVAAVEPATYRNYTDPDSARTQEVWDRVAGGELALRPDLSKKLPQDENGFLKLGSTDEAPRVHIGALAPQMVQVDAVVNETWIDSLDMTADNALLVRTGTRVPKDLRKPIEKLAGANASVQLVDVATREGIDPNVQQTAVTVGTIADVVGVYNYTVLGGGRIAPSAEWERTHIATKFVPILGLVTCNRYLFPQLEAALREVVERGLADEIYPGEYAGCYYPRFIAGSTRLSNHAFGLALDLNTRGNQRGTVGEIDRDVVAIFKSWGFGWGGDWGYTDPMHFEMVALVNPQTVSSKQ